MCGRICSIVHFWWNLHYWQQLYTTGNNFTLLATILHYWQQFYTTGNNLTLLATILHYWQQFYTAGKHFLLLATILQYWQQSYTAGNNFTLRTTDGSTGSDKYHLLKYFKDWNELSQNQQKKLCKPPCISYLQIQICNVNRMYPTF